MDNSRKPPDQGQPGMTPDRQALADAQKYHQQRIRAQETGNQDQLAQIRQKLQAGGNPNAQQLTQTADTSAVDKGILATVPSLAGAPEMAGAAGIKTLISKAAPMVGRLLGQMGLKDTAGALVKEAASFGEGAAEKGVARAAGRKAASGRTVTASSRGKQVASSTGSSKRFVNSQMHTDGAGLSRGYKPSPMSGAKSAARGAPKPATAKASVSRPTTAASKRTGQTTPKVKAQTRKPVTAAKPAPKAASVKRASTAPKKVTDPRTVKPPVKPTVRAATQEGTRQATQPRQASGAQLQRRAQAIGRAKPAPKTAKPKTEAEPRTAADKRDMMSKLKRSVEAAKKRKAQAT